MEIESLILALYMARRNFTPNDFQGNNNFPHVEEREKKFYLKRFVRSSDFPHYKMFFLLAFWIWQFFLCELDLILLFFHCIICCVIHISRYSDFMWFSIEIRFSKKEFPIYFHVRDWPRVFYYLAPTTNERFSGHR